MVFGSLDEKTRLDVYLVVGRPGKLKAPNSRNSRIIRESASHHVFYLHCAGARKIVSEWCLWSQEIAWKRPKLNFQVCPKMSNFCRSVQGIPNIIFTYQTTPVKHRYTLWNVCPLLSLIPNDFFDTGQKNMVWRIPSRWMPREAESSEFKKFGN